MATNDTESVFKALRDKLLELTTTPETTIAWPNENYTPAAYPYLEVNFIPYRVGSVTQSGDLKRHDGEMQVNIVEEKGKGMFRTARIASQIEDHFKEDHFFGGDGRSVSTSEPVAVEAGLVSENEVRTPVRVFYSSFSAVG